MSPLRVAAAQAVSVPGDVDANVATAVGLVESAAGRGARLVVLPELFLTGYAPETWTHDASLTPEDERLVPLSLVAGEHGVVVVAGAAVRRAPDPSTGSGRRASTLSLLVLSGDEVLGPYDKQHLDAAERFFTPGDHGATLRVDGWELGLGICYDGCFPEHARAAAAGGATAYLLPSAYYVGAESRRDLYGAARALDNGMYVVLSGLTGRCGEGSFSGGSAVYDPEGRALDRLGDESPGLVLADLDPAVVEQTRRRHPMLQDRLPDQGPRRLTSAP